MVLTCWSVCSVSFACEMRHALLQCPGRTSLSRSPLPSRLRSRRYQSSGSPQKQDSIPDQQKLSQSNVQNTPSASSAPAPRSLRHIIADGPLGRLGRSYSRIQERRPYTTQLWSSIIVYLCGDLSAQLLFPSQNTSVPSPAFSMTPSVRRRHVIVRHGTAHARAARKVL